MLVRYGPGIAVVMVTAAFTFAWVNNAASSKLPTNAPDFELETNSVANEYQPSDLALSRAGGVADDRELSFDDDPPGWEHCECLICNVTGTAASIQLFTKSMGDGLGSVATHIIYAAAIAARLGMVFRGAVGQDGVALLRHRAEKRGTLDFLFGNHRNVMSLRGPLQRTFTRVALGRLVPPKGMLQRPWEDFEHNLDAATLSVWRNASLPVRGVQYWHDAQYEPSENNMDFILPSSFRQKLRAQWECGMRAGDEAAALGVAPAVNIPWTPAASIGSAGKPLNVVAHYRRGDAEIQGYRAIMMLHRQWYFKIMTDIQGLNPGARLRAFTSCFTESQCAEFAISEVPTWAAHGIKLVVDNELGPDPTGDWKRTFAQLASADVFIMAKSSLSHLAAFYSAGCVIRSSADRKHAPLSSWIKVTEPPVPKQSYISTEVAGKHFRAVDWHAYNGPFNSSAMIVVGRKRSGSSLSQQLRSAMEECLGAASDGGRKRGRRALFWRRAARFASDGK